MTYENILVETRGRVGLVTLNRPKQLNALSDALMDELGQALGAFDADAAIGAIVLTGSERAFAAGADVGGMAQKTFSDVYAEQFITRNWETIRGIRKPIIAAVAGVALGGGCELAMMCDIVVPRTPRASASPRSSWASFRARAGRNASHVPWARPRPWTSSSPAG